MQPCSVRTQNCLIVCTLQSDDEYMVRDHDLLLNRFTSVPRAYAGFNPGGAIVAGVVRGLMETAGFPCGCVGIFFAGVPWVVYCRQLLTLCWAQSINVRC
jgi:hypothetical protein